MLVTDPKGQTRRLVGKSSQGLVFDYESMKTDHSGLLWKFDLTECILSFNVKHPLWQACEVKDSALMRLQEHIAMQALTLQLQPETFRIEQRKFADEMNPALVHWLLRGDCIRSPKTKKKADTEPCEEVDD